MGCRLHVGGSVHKIGRLPSIPSGESEVSGDLEDRAILVSGDDEEEDGDVGEVPDSDLRADDED